MSTNEKTTASLIPDCTGCAHLYLDTLDSESGLPLRTCLHPRTNHPLGDCTGFARSSKGHCGYYGTGFFHQDTEIKFDA